MTERFKLGFQLLVALGLLLFAVYLLFDAGFWPTVKLISGCALAAGAIGMAVSSFEDFETAVRLERKR